MSMIQKEVKNAIAQFGYTTDSIRVASGVCGCYRVDLDGEYFGILDTDKNTFVD